MSNLYKYIMGKEVLVEEHMLSANEIAQLYCIYSSSKNPHGMLITAVIKEFISRKNLNVNDYFYPHQKGVMKVYPQVIWEKAMEDFAFRQKHYQYQTGEIPLTYAIEAEKKAFNYSYCTPKQKVISLNERRKENGNI